MTNAWVAGTLVAVVAGVVGFFVVLRSSAFAAHAIPNGAFAGAAGAALAGVDTLVGLGVFAALAALTIAALGHRARRDVATALTLVLLLALGDAFLAQTSAYANAVFALLFGQILGVGSGDLPVVAGLAGASVVAAAVLARPLLLASAVPDIAEARGVRLAAMDLAFLLLLALATAVAVPVVGVLLIFSLLIGPPAAARAVVRSPLPAVLLSVALAAVTVWASIAASYLTNWPVGFFVGALSAGVYGAARLAAWGAGRAGRAGRGRAAARACR